MCKLNLVKKSIFSALVALYDVVSVFWCYIISSSIIYQLTNIHINDASMGIIGGADLPTGSFLIGGILRCVCSVLFVLLSLTTVFLFTISIFKKQTNRKLNILLCIFLVLTLIIYMLIPAQTYVVSLYALVRKLSFLKYIQFIYVILSLMIIVTNILFAIKSGNKTQ